MANDVFNIATDFSIRYLNASTGLYVEIVADSFEVEIDRGIDIDNGVLAEPRVSSATIKLVKKNLADFLGTPSYKSGDLVNIRYKPNPDTVPGIYNDLFTGNIQNVSMQYINESQTLEITIVADDGMKRFLNTILASHSVTGTVVQRSFRNCMINVAASIGMGLIANGSAASGTTQRAFTWTNTTSGEIVSKFLDAELGWLYSKTDGGLYYETRGDIAAKQAIAYSSAAPTVSNVHYENMITNGNFEINTTGWTTSTGNVTLTRDTSTFYMGVASMRVNSILANTTPFSAQTNTTMNFSHLDKVKASVWVKSQTNSPTARVEIRFNNSGGGQISLVTGAYTAIDSSGWTQVSLTTVAPAGTVSAQMFVTSSKTSSAVGSFFMDNAKLEDLSTISNNHFCLDSIALNYDSDLLVNKCVVVDGTALTRTVASNTASITASGEQSGTFTVDFDPAGASTYSQWATRVVNSASIKQVSQVTTPVIRDDGLVGDIARREVGSTLQVEFAQDPLPPLQVISLVSRVNHIITPDMWLMNIGLWRGM